MKALMRSEAEFRASFEAAAVGKTQSDAATGRLLRVNGALARMLGYEPEEMVGRIGWEFTWPDDAEADKDGYQQVLADGGGVYIREKRYRHKDGRPVWGRVSATIVRAPDTGEPYLTVAVIEDIDERHKAREALQAAKHDLEGMVAERTAAVVQRDLLLREVYHRVKNNLQIIDAMLVMQARELSDVEARAALTGLRSRVYALGLVHHQLMGSADLKTFDVAPFLTELTDNILQGGGARGVTLAVRATPLKVGLDFAIPLGLVVTELVTNSLKHAFPGGEGHIEVELDWDDAGWVTLVVADNGKGQDSAAAGSGKALGARVIEGLVAQLGGTMTVHNHNGSRSEIRLPTPELA
jgi:PAS domain S-box-containing protein